MDKYITLESLDKISYEMEHLLGCDEIIPFTYARIINYFIAAYYEEGITLFKQFFYSGQATDREQNIRIVRYYDIGMLKQKKYKELVEFLSAFANEIKHADIYNDYGIALFRIHDYNNSILVMDMALGLNPNSEVINNNRKKIIDYYKSGSSC